MAKINHAVKKAMANAALTIASLNATRDTISFLTVLAKYAPQAAIAYLAQNGTPHAPPDNTATKAHLHAPPAPPPYTTGAAGTGKTINGCSVSLKQGVYVSNDTVTTCPAGYYCPGGTTYYGDKDDNGDNGAIICPENHYCPAGTSEPIQCPTDEAPYSKAGAKSKAECFLCDDGTYRDENVTECTTCPEGYFCTGGQKTACPAGEYNDQTGQTSCKDCPAGYYCTGGVNKEKCPGYSETSNIICNSQNTCTNNALVTNLEDLKAIYRDRPINNAYPSEITAITGVAIPSYLTAAEKITQCGATYTVTNQRGTFVQERIMYNETTGRYDNPINATIYYSKILPGYYAKTKLYTQEGQCTSTSNRLKLYTDAVPCPAGQYCEGFKDGMPTCDENYPDVLGISGNIAAGYYSTGGGKLSTPSGPGEGCLNGSECGTIAAGYYSTGGAKNATPTISDCVGTTTDGAKNTCGTIAAGYYSTGGATSKIPANCVSGGECGILAGGRFATCGAKISEPTNDEHCATKDCNCGFTSPGYYSTGGGTLHEPKGVGNGCLDGSECGPCYQEKNEFCPIGSDSKKSCDTGKYCKIIAGDSNLRIYNCPVGTTSNAGSTEITDCFIDSNTKFCVKDTANQAINRCFNLPLPTDTTINLKYVN